MNYKSMLKLSAIFCLIMVVIPVQIHSQNFEGKVRMKISNDGETSYLDYLVKEEKFRIEPEESQGGGVMIMNMKDQNMMVIMPEQKMYMTFPMKSHMKNFKNENKEDLKSKMENIKMTGETKTINGYECEKMIYQDDEQNVEAWVTQELGGFMFFNNPMGGNEEDFPDWYSGFGDKFFPMLVIVKDDAGDEESRFEVVSVDKESLSSDLFDAPAGYKKMDMPMMNMGGQN